MSSSTLFCEAIHVSGLESAVTDPVQRVGTEHERRGARTANADHALQTARMPNTEQHRGAARTERDAARLSALVVTYFDFAWRSLRRLGVNEAALDDAVQQLFLVLERRLDEIAPDRERSFVFGTAVRLAANLRRGQRRASHEVGAPSEELLADPSPSPEELLDMKRARAFLDDILDAMPLELRAVFILAEGEGLTRREIAELCDIPEGTVGSRLRRAREIYERRIAEFGQRTGAMP